MTIYFDHASTSWPKPQAVNNAVISFLSTEVGNPGRSGHKLSIAGAKIVEDAREEVAELFNVSDSSRLTFTKNATEALNLAIQGSLSPGDHVITTSLEHNSVMRVLRYLEEKGVEVTVVQNNELGLVDEFEIEDAILPHSKMIITTHASNVTGALVDIETVSKIAQKNELLYLVDASQTGGVIDIDIAALNVSMLAFTGHKALLGLAGTGGLYVNENLNLKPLIFGGTGSSSESQHQPDFMPDCYESGTINMAGLSSLAAGIKYIKAVGINVIRSHEKELLSRFINGVKLIKKVNIYGPQNANDRCAVVSFNIDGLVSSEVGLLLENNYGIVCRVGLHCSPITHKALGTLPTGTIRFSFGYSNTIEEVDQAIKAILDISQLVLNPKKQECDDE